MLFRLTSPEFSTSIRGRAADIALELARLQNQLEALPGSGSIEIHFSPGVVKVFVRHRIEGEDTVVELDKPRVSQ